MSYDLHGGLYDLSGDPVTDRELPLPQILRRLHHTRRVHTVSYSAVGAAAVVAIALGFAATGADRGREPILPVDTPSPTFTSQSSWSPTPMPTPPTTLTPTDTPPTTLTPKPSPKASSPSYLDPALRCGTTVDLSNPLAASEYDLMLTNRSLEYGPQITSDPAAPFRLSIGILRWPLSQSVKSARIVNVLAGHGEAGSWTIAGVPKRSPRPVPDPISPILEGFPVAADVELVTCDGSPLGENTYSLAATVEITRADGSVVTSTFPFWAYIGAEPTGEPIRYPPPQKSGDPAQVDSSARLDAAGLPSCGAAYARGPVPGAGLSVTGSASFSYKKITAGITVANTGLAIADGRVVGPFLTVTQNGVVVGQTQDLVYGAWALMDWTLDATVERSAALIDSACEPMDATLPPGDYEVWAMVTVWTGPNTNDTPQFFYGGPWPVTIP